MTTLTPEQQALVAEWAATGATLNDIQQRLRSELGITLTYLDARLLLLDLKVSIKDKPREEPKPEPAPAVPAASEDVAEAAAPAEDSPVPAGNVSVSLDEITVPGAIASGRVTFSDGKTAIWYVDQMGRLGMRAPEPGYQPPPADVPVFQNELDRVLMQAGL